MMAMNAGFSSHQDMEYISFALESELEGDLS